MSAPSSSRKLTAEIIVVGAGVMGLWSALTLRRRGHDVLLLDAWGPGHSRATSGDENRVIRCGYGRSDFYAQWAWRATSLWTAWQESWNERVLFPCGVLWMVTGNEPYVRASHLALRRLKIPHERIDRKQFVKRYPQISAAGIRWALLEPEAGLILARRACEVIARAFESGGGCARVAEVRPGAAARRRLGDVAGAGGERFSAEQFVFACGPWLPGIFPSVLRRRIRVTRKEVVYFGTPPGDGRFSAARCPVWMEAGTSFYGLPAVAGRGFKVHPDVPGRQVDPTSQDRRPTARILGLARACLRRRFPDLSDAPVVESRVCQYESTADDHMIFDLHPDFENVWIAGGGSGHCFKHGPVIGEVVADAVEARSADGIPAELRLTHVPAGRHF